MKIIVFNSLLVVGFCLAMNFSLAQECASGTSLYPTLPALNLRVVNNGAIAQRDYFLIDSKVATSEKIENMIKSAKSVKEKRLVQWRLDSIVGAISSRLPDSAALSKYAIEFPGGLQFFVKGNELFCKNGERDNEIFKLIFITEDYFVLDENVHIQFVKDNSDKLVGIKMFWNYGTVTFKPTKECLDFKVKEWDSNNHKARSSNVLVPLEKLQLYVGKFEGLNFYVKEKKLFCKNGERDGEVFQMRSINDNMFLLDENAQVEFVKSKTGKVIGLALNWSDGTTSFKAKDL